MEERLTLDSAAADWDCRFVRPLLEWYGRDARVLPWRSDPTPYHVWVSEIMLQQTRVEPALPYYQRFMRELPAVQDLAACPEEKLLKLWEGLGYYSRARNLQRAAQMLLTQYGGRFPLTVKELTNLPGIGEYTAGAILSIAFQKPVPAVDGNVTRVLSRVALYEEDVTLPKCRTRMGEAIARFIPPRRPGDLNQALMDLGATVCRPNGEPLCAACPVCGCCGALREKRTGQLPVKPPKKARRIEERTVLLILSARGVLLRRRQEKGLLAGMWEYPQLSGALSRQEVHALLGQRGLKCAVRALSPARHIFTHLEWHMTGYLVQLDAVPALPDRESQIWAGRRELSAIYAVPSAFKVYTALLQKLPGMAEGAAPGDEPGTAPAAAHQPL